jgi:cell division protease FtsH
VFGTKEAPQPDGFLTFLKNYGFLIVAILIGVWFVSNMRKAAKSQSNQVNGMGGMGKSRGKTFGGKKDANGKDEPKQTLEKVTWDDVAGCDEAVTELKRLVEGLVGRDIYKKFGAELPKGVLLVGPPGTGKTLLARVVANVTDGGFEAASGSDFVEMLVGVGASRVRDTFEKARKYVAEHKKPFVIFIDEIDAIGGKRSTGMNSNSEREQTLNALLVELDGVVGNDGVIVIAATNRVDMLDEALVRPGRFDCQVNVDLPDVVGREKIFAIHTKNKAPGAEDVTPKRLAKISFGYSGAEIKTACNRAAFLAAEAYDRSVRELIAQGVPADQAAKQVPVVIPMGFFDEGLTFARFGDAKVSKQTNMTKKTMLNTAWHEGGHAFASAFFKQHSDPVVKITIMRRSKALGYVQTMPEVDMVGLTRKQCLARIVMAMAGRAAQEVYLRTCDSGASSDFQQATSMARRMVMEWGMSSEIGRLAIPRGDNQLGGGLPGIGNDLANAIDREVRRITDACYAAAIAIVKAEKAGMTRLVEMLMERETVLGDEFKTLREEMSPNLNINDLNLPFWTEGEDEYELSA